MRYGTPPVHYHRLESYDHALPEQMECLLRLLEENLGANCIPLIYEVGSTGIDAVSK